MEVDGSGPKWDLAFVPLDLNRHICSKAAKFMLLVALDEGVCSFSVYQQFHPWLRPVLEWSSLAGLCFWLCSVSLPKAAGFIQTPCPGSVGLGLF